MVKIEIVGNFQIGFSGESIIVVVVNLGQKHCGKMCGGVVVKLEIWYYNVVVQFIEKICGGDKLVVVENLWW